VQAFVRRGFQLRTASIETRIAYTAFLVLMLPGIASLAALSAGRIGLSPHAIAGYYRGGLGEMSFPKTFWQLVEVSHFHLFTIPVVALILSHLTYATPLSVRARIWLTSALFAGAFLDIAGPWLVRYGAPAFAWLLLLGWTLLSVSGFLIVALTLWSMWGPAPDSPGALEPE
jgi:hypothetical protein